MLGRTLRLHRAPNMPKATSDPSPPRRVRYQTAPHSDIFIGLRRPQNYFNPLRRKQPM